MCWRASPGCAAESDVVIVEGAGSASEVNLRRNDIANMGFARAAGVPVVLIGDIDRGGVIASLVGTQAVLDPGDAALIGGFIVNRMRGDAALFAEGMAFIAARTGWAPMGLVPFFADAHRLPPEDAADLTAERPRGGDGRLRIAVPVLPGIANFDDLDPLRAERQVDLLMLHHGAAVPADCDLVILPGSKTTIADLAALRAAGWDADIIAHHRRGGHVLGLCGGYQMLGLRVSDPDGIEGPPGSVPGLGLLDVETLLKGPKQLRAVRGVTADNLTPLHGYEMHMGITKGADTARPMIRLDDGRDDGARSADGRVFGSYIHGFFIDDAQRSAWLTRFGGARSDRHHMAETESLLDDLAVHVTRHCDVEAMMNLAASAQARTT